MAWRVLLLSAAGALVGVAAEWTAFGFDDPWRWIPDLAVGWTFIACGLIGVQRRPRSRTGTLLAATGFAWFIGNFAAIGVESVAWVAAHLLYLHRGLLIHCVLSFPTGRLSSRSQQVVVALGYVAAVVMPIARNELATMVLGVLVIAVVIHGQTAAAGPARRDRAVRIRVAVAVGLSLAAGAAARLVFPSKGTDEAVLLGYQVVLCIVGVGMLIELLRQPWGETAVTDLVVELTEAPTGTLREALAQVLGDPTIEVGYRVPGADGYVDARGQTIHLAEAGAGRAITPIELDGRVLGVLVHDPAVLDDPGLLGSITAATRLAAAHARLQAEVRAQIAEVEASRRRLVHAGDEERMRLQRRLAEGAERRLHIIAATLARVRELADGVTTSGDTLDRTEQADRQVQRTLEDLHELARGLRPPSLEGSGLADALSDPVEQSPVPIELDVTTADIPPDIATAAYYLCSEALANMAKYAHASAGVIKVAIQGGQLVVEITDDGVGGADVWKGSGIRGLTDRIEALGGRLVVDSPPGAGTRLIAEIPLGDETR